MRSVHFFILANVDKKASLYDWFDTNRKNLIDGHYGKRVLVHNNALLAYFDDEKSAVRYAKSQDLLTSGYPRSPTPHV